MTWRIEVARLSGGVARFSEQYREMCHCFGEAVPRVNDALKNTASPRTPKQWHGGVWVRTFVRQCVSVVCFRGLNQVPLMSLTP